MTKPHRQPTLSQPDQIQSSPRLRQHDFIESFHQTSTARQARISNIARDYSAGRRRCKSNRSATEPLAVNSCHHGERQYRGATQISVPDLIWWPNRADDCSDTSCRRSL